MEVLRQTKGSQHKQDKINSEKKTKNCCKSIAKLFLP